jgi:hypothetical protein
MNFEEFLNEELLFEKMVPMNYSLEDWEKSGITPKDYNEKNPSSKWKIVHCHKKGEIGKPLPGATDLSYEKASKMHKAIAMGG